MLQSGGRHPAVPGVTRKKKICKQYLKGKCIGDHNPNCNLKHPEGRYNEKNNPGNTTTAVPAPYQASGDAQQQRGRTKGDAKGKKGDGKGRSGSPRGKLGPDGKKRLPCKFWQTGQCPNTDEACWWPHRKPTPEEAEEMRKIEERRKSQSPSPGVSNRLCKYFQQGKCTKGDSCKFSHDNNNAAQAAPVGAPIK